MTKKYRCIKSFPGFGLGDIVYANGNQSTTGLDPSLWPEYFEEVKEESSEEKLLKFLKSLRSDKGYKGYMTIDDLAKALLERGLIREEKL